MIAIGRAAIGVFAIASPTRALEPWIGDDAERPSGRLLARALGARDLVLALGALRAMDNDENVRPWVAAGVLADGVDFAATCAGSGLPARGRLMIGALAGGAAAAGAIALASLDSES